MTAPDDYTRLWALLDTQTGAAPGETGSALAYADTASQAAPDDDPRSMGWSATDERQNPQGGSWKLAWGRAMIMLIGGVAAAISIGVLGYAVSRGHVAPPTQPPAPRITVTVPAAPPSDPDTRGQPYDEEFLRRMRSRGYDLSDESSALRHAHETCRLFREGQSTIEVLDALSAQMGGDKTRAVQLFATAHGAYPDCGGATQTPSPPTADQEYFSALNRVGANVTNAAQAIATGHEVCTQMAAGGTQLRLADAMAGDGVVVQSRTAPSGFAWSPPSHGVSDWVAQWSTAEGIVSAAVRAYCPQFRG